MSAHNKSVYSWAFYDWANSAFATTVLAGFFPIFFKEFWSIGTDATVSTFRLGAANSAASLIIVVLAPILGAIADAGGSRKRWLMVFALMGIVMTGALYFIEQGSWGAAIGIYAIAALGFSGANIFYDSLLVSVAPEDKLHFVSGLGFAMGYLGGGILFSFNVWLTLWPEFFGLDDATTAVRLSFICVAVWWAIFSVPLLLFVKEPDRTSNQGDESTVKRAFKQLKLTFSKIRQLRMVFLFLLGYWFYIDGVDTVIRMAVDYGLSLGFDSNVLIVALLVTQFVGFPSAIVFGKLGENIGAKPGIVICIGVYLAITVWAVFIDEVYEFYVMAIAVGLVQGGVQALSRSLYAQIIPQRMAGEFFGFYNMLGKFAAVIGPVLMGWTGLIFGNPRVSILSLAILFIIGAFLLSRVNVEQGQQAAKSI